MPHAVVVELLSLSTRHFDLSVKLAGYFRVESVAHYLTVDPKPRLTHHARAESGTILTKIVSDGMIKLDRPGIELAFDSV
jgi:hypothetical protein